MKRDAQSIVKTHYNVNELIEPETQKVNVKALIGTSDCLLATYLCGVLVSTYPFPVFADHLSDTCKPNFEGPNPKGLFKHSAVKALILKSLFQGSNKGKSLAYHLYTRSPEYLEKLFSPLRFEVFALAGAAVSSLLQ